MQKSSIHITTLTILLSILTVIIQFSSYYFFDASFVTYGLTTLVVLLFTHILLEQFLSYESCFSYTLLNIFICFIIIVLSSFGGEVSILPYKDNLLLFVILNWTIPTLYCIIRCLLDRGPKYSHFNSFFRNVSIIFVLFYVGVLVFKLFIQSESNILYYTDFKSINLIPFLTLATLIEDYIDGYVSLNSIITYLVQNILLFAPYGFYSILMLRHHRRLTRAFALLFLPLLIEVLQRVFLLGKGDIDDIILAMIGGTLGSFVYHLLNSIFYSVTDEDFLFERSPYSFYRNSLHF